MIAENVLVRSEKNFKSNSFIDMKKKYKIMKFYSDHCAPCRTMNQVLTIFKNTIQKQDQSVDVDYVDINIDTDDKEKLELMSKYHVRTVPTIVIMNQETNQESVISGAVSLKVLQEKFKMTA